MNVPNQLSQNTRSTSVVKKYFSKFTMLIVAALSIAGVVFSFLAGDMSSSFISFLISAVVAVMLTLIYFSCKKGSNPKLYFGVLYVLSLIEFIGFILIALVTTIALFFVIVSPKTIVSYILNNPDTIKTEIPGFDLSQSQEEIMAQVDQLKIAMLIVMIIMIAVFVVVAIFISAQTSFLNSCRKSCKGTALYYDGASSYGTLSMVVGFIYLVTIVIAFLMSRSGESGIEGLGEESAALTAMTVSTMALVGNIVSAASILVRGTFAKGWMNWAKENVAWVEDGNVVTTTRSDSSNAMATFKATTRKSNDAIHQSQAYTYGTDEDQRKNPTNKKSEYIPEELQNDYPPQQYDQGMGGMMNDPFMGDPFAQPNAGNPYGQDPFAADPFAADPFAQQPPMGGNPYGGGMPNASDSGYNNG